MKKAAHFTQYLHIVIHENSKIFRVIAVPLGVAFGDLALVDLALADLSLRTYNGAHNQTQYPVAEGDPII